MLNDFSYIQLTNLLDKYDEKDVLKFLETFVCEKNSDVQDFIRNKAIIFEKGNKCKTYLIYTGDIFNQDSIIGFFSIAMQSISIDTQLCSKSQLKKFKKLNNSEEFRLDGILIAQIGKLM